MGARDYRKLLLLSVVAEGGKEGGRKQCMDARKNGR